MPDPIYDSVVAVRAASRLLMNYETVGIVARARRS